MQLRGKAQKKENGRSDMKFAFNVSLKNIRRRPFRSAALGALVMLLTICLFLGAEVILSLQGGLDAYRSRLGADVIVTPSSASAHGSVDDIFLQGITGNYYMSEKDIKKAADTYGVQSISRQFYLTSAKAGCCSARVQIIGFEPETDFSVLPWIKESYSGEIRNGDIVVGSEISVPSDRQIKFYGKKYNVAAILGKTGTGLDNAVFTGYDTIKEMARSAADIISRKEFSGVNIDNTASALLIRVKDGYDPQTVADDINIHITKVQAKASKSMISGLSDGLSGISGIIAVLVGAVWVFCFIIMLMVFALLSNERKKEFAVFRIIGASGKMLTAVMAGETAVLCLAGSAAGLLVSVPLCFPLSDMIHSSLSLPLLMPDGAVLAALCAGAAVIPLITGVLISLASAVRITKAETGLLLREGA